uniref:Coiled-coil domain-containing protein 77 n=1 Tax=Globisporangium ultimum (strain ATCC 200006 / CBS 805.95 / DAOM BR144) TaxID=431595 RepID=K3X1V5_GLOUD
MLDHITQIEVSKEEFHRLKWELRMKNEEISELEDSLKKSNATLFQVKTELVDVQAENKKLRIQEEKDRQKIQHLLALTQPIAEEVVFIRDCRPGTRTSYPISPTPTLQTYTYPSTMHISSEMGSQPRRKNQPMRSLPTKVPVRVSSARQTSNKVLRTVYLPNEQAAALAKTVESLQKQLVAHQQLSEERIQALLDEFANEKAKLAQEKQQIEDKAQLFERQLEKSQRLLHQTTKDYLVLRHQSQEAERLAHEELHRIQEKCDTLNAEQKEVIEQAVVETQALRRSIQEEGNVCAQEFRNQAQSRERDLHILKEQYAAVQEACTRRIQDLQARLTKLRSRYRSLDKRRAMEMEGFTRDITALKRHLQKLEVMQYGRRLTAQERQNLRLDEHFTLDSNELSEEVAALQHRVMELAADLADA